MTVALAELLAIDLLYCKMIGVCKYFEDGIFVTVIRDPSQSTASNIYKKQEVIEQNPRIKGFSVVVIMSVTKRNYL